MRAVTLERNPTMISAAKSGARLLDIDANTFRDKFDRTPFLIGHKLCDHPLFDLTRLMQLARSLPEANVEYNAGNIPVSADPAQTPRTGLSIEETVRRIEECKSWMVLKYVERDEAYRDLLHRCLAEVREYSEPLRPNMQQAEGFIFLSSPRSVTPYHMDPEHNFLLQIRGNKIVHLFDPRDPTIIGQEELERFYGPSHRNMVLREENRSKAMVFNLQPGQGLHFPVTAPHFVQNGESVSVSFSITFRTPDLERRSMIHNVNAFLRRRGLKPSAPGIHEARDEFKYQAFRIWRRTRGLLGKS